METIRLQFTLFSAFYSPLISTMSGGFLKSEGLDPVWSISPPGVSAIAALADGSANVVQTALSQGFASLDKGETPPAVHFAQVNEMDGFFLTGRTPDPSFTWKKLEGAELVTFKGGQPHAMFRYACHQAGIDYSKIKLITPGGPADINKAYEQARQYMMPQEGAGPNVGGGPIAQTRIGWGSNARGMGRDSDRPDDKARGETMRMAAQSFEFNIENGLAVVGSPDTVIKKLEAGKQKIGYDIFAGNFAIGRMPEDLVATSIDLFGREVIPAFR